MIADKPIEVPGRWCAAAGFTLLALVYAVMVHWRAGWIAFIGGPLIVIAMLFAGSARHRLPQ